MIAWEHNRRYIGSFDSARLDEEGPDGTYLVIGTTDAEVRFRVHAEDVLVLDAALQPLRDYRAEYERQRAAYNAASPEERDAVIEGTTRDSFEGHGDFNSDDPLERHIAHQAAKGNL